MISFIFIVREFDLKKCDGFVSQKLHYWFIRCVEKDTKNWKTSCFQKYGGEKAITDCYNGDLSKKVCIIYTYIERENIHITYN